MPKITAIVIFRMGAASVIAAWLLALTFANAAVRSELAADFEGKLWRIARATFEQKSISPRGQDGFEAHLSFQNGQMSGNATCGQFAGPYSFAEERIQISATLKGETHSCSSELRQQADFLTSALNEIGFLERGAEDAIYLFDEQRKIEVRLELLSPGFDFSELRATFWSIVDLGVSGTSAPDAVIWFDTATIGILQHDSLAEFPFRYTLRSFSFTKPWTTTRPGSGDLPPLFENFEKALHEISRYEAGDGKLALFDSDGRRIMLLQQIRSKGVEYRFWRITEYLADGLLKRPFSQQVQVIYFLGGKLQGTAGCSALGGDYTLSGTGLSVQAGSSFVGYCSNQDRNENDAILAALGRSSVVIRDGVRMLLQDNKGKTQVVLMPYLPQTQH